MKYQSLFKEANENAMERYELVIERLEGILADNTVPEEYQEYFAETTQFLLYLNSLSVLQQQGTLFDADMAEWQARNEKLYGSVKQETYDTCYGNPTYAVEQFGTEVGQLLSFLYAELQAGIGYVYEGRLFAFVMLCELYIQVYNCFETEGQPDVKEAKEIIYWFFHDYSEIFATWQAEEMINPDYDFCVDIVMNSDLNDLSYLYHYGLPVGENELKIAAYLNTMSQEEIQAMADTYTEGYRIGFEMTGKDLSKKKTVQIRYNIGFERMIRAAIQNFEKLDLKPTIAKDILSSFFGRAIKRGAYSTSVNKQYDFDHREDRAYYFNKMFVERRLEVLRTAFEQNKKLASLHGGPAVLEVFGEEPFAPVNKEEALHYSDKQQQLNVYNASVSGQITNEYIKGEERSFTIIAYPVPAIGDKFEEIFAETVKINTLDYTTYQRIQQKLIDVLDQAEYVHIKGKGDNQTDLRVSIYPLTDLEKQTAFENCVADVNIPVGEVFTSPVLKGTTGTLHVTEVFLNELKYENLKIVFEDGMITAYDCSNFATEAENQKYIKDNVLMHHDTLPMGEFAIGTNTTAYRMGMDYQIMDELPILIAEKCGPHFAVGDTCYSHAEDRSVYNPDGKEIMARDNEVSLLRKEDMSKAYYNCHTDITIPYHELDTITVFTRDGGQIPVIVDGRFVVEGTEELNVPLDEM
ncbi:MAG: aminopeptidase [Eubacterium sp.]|nr:aminopeptidase [Eubacterium sp.]